MVLVNVQAVGSGNAIEIFLLLLCMHVQETNQVVGRVAVIPLSFPI